MDRSFGPMSSVGKKTGAGLALAAHGWRSRPPNFRAEFLDHRLRGFETLLLRGVDPALLELGDSVADLFDEGRARLRDHDAVGLHHRPTFSIDRVPPAPQQPCQLLAGYFVDRRFVLG